MISLPTIHIVVIGFGHDELLFGNSLSRRGGSGIEESLSDCQGDDRILLAMNLQDGTGDIDNPTVRGIAVNEQPGNGDQRKLGLGHRDQ